MEFSEALGYLKKGYPIFRTGWNGKGMFIYLEKGTSVPTSTLNNVVSRYLTPIIKNEKGTQLITESDHINMKAADDSIIVGWLASQSDLLSSDWLVYKG